MGSIEAGTDEVNNGMKAMNEVGDVFKHILESVHRVTEQIQEVTATSEQMSAGTEEVTASVTEMSHIAKESEEKSKHVVQIYQEQSLKINDTRSLVNELKNYSNELQEMLIRFKF
ncbi:hypothetical protein HQN89_26945 [Paenibacillus frigoriresistens]|nr:hypothetical protein [Paenibacillus frigoriresistens]